MYNDVAVAAIIFLTDDNAFLEQRKVFAFIMTNLYVYTNGRLLLCFTRMNVIDKPIRHRAARRRQRKYTWK